MKKRTLFWSWILLILLSFQTVFAQDYTNGMKKAEAAGFTYWYAENDPMKARMYVLDNGLTVYLSAYNSEPSIQTFIAVKAGGKNDPAHATGLAHYLEHMMFKGTSKFGTQNWDKEKVLLDKLADLFEEYRSLKDPEARKAKYAEIDAISQEAAGYAIANEFDKMMSLIGGTGINAYTNDDRTVYMSSIPSNELERWLTIEKERFSEIVLRLFHTELEAVYEEKNRSLDNDMWQLEEKMNATIFKKHPYGTQTVIGTIDHLKNPSMKEISKYFYQYYVPSNLAVCLSGDLDYDQTIKAIQATLGTWEPKSVPQISLPMEDNVTENQTIEVFGPNEEGVSIGYRGVGNNAYEDMLKLELASLILSNGKAGIIDIDINQSQKAIDAYAYASVNNDYSVFKLGASPQKNQSLEEVRDLLFAAVEKLKKGDFDEKLLQQSIDNMSIQLTKRLEKNGGRAHMFVEAFSMGISWDAYIHSIDIMKKITKAELVKFCNESLVYSVVGFKRTGDISREKVTKPSITQVQVNRDAESEFFKKIAQMETKKMQVETIDFSKALNKKEIQKGISFVHLPNAENDLFTLSISFKTGTLKDKNLSLLSEFLPFIGNKNSSAEEIQKELFNVGVNFRLSAGDEETVLNISGKSESMNTVLSLLEGTFKAPTFKTENWDTFISDIVKSREERLKNKDFLLDAMRSYVRFGDKSKYVRSFSNKELGDKDLSKNIILSLQSLRNYPQEIFYYGPKSMGEIEKTLKEKLPFSKKMLPAFELKQSIEKDITEEKVYWIDFDMVQAEAFMLCLDQKYDQKLSPYVSMFNAYFGGDMSSIVFQEIRESRALAYSVSAGYNQPRNLRDRSIFGAYVGTQADKLKEALEVMTQLVNDMPKSESTFEKVKKGYLTSLESDRLVKENIYYTYKYYQKLGIEKDLRAEQYEIIKSLKFEDILEFQKKHIVPLKKVWILIGKKDNLDFEMLKKYGELVELKIENIFNY